MLTSRLAVLWSYRAATFYLSVLNKCCPVSEEIHALRIIARYIPITLIAVGSNTPAIHVRASNRFEIYLLICCWSACLALGLGLQISVA